ncbi:MAG TPA: adenine deaminase, partial [Holophaga sp.]|nr:adenine deaminase [Holophaga sp.]
IGDYEGTETHDAGGRYASPGFTDSHIHIESSYVSPEEIGRLLVPHGATTIIADPHEIVNVLGLPGLDYMLQAARNTALDIQFMIPSCVPATPFEHAGARIDAAAMAQRIEDPRVLGLGEFMNFPGVIQAQDEILDKLMVGHGAGKLVDGHSPALVGSDLNAYVAAGIHTDHECSTTQELQDRISRGLYVLLREGSACHNIRDLLKAVTPANARRCLLCSDDRQPKTIFEKGHLEDHLRICVEMGIAPVEALRMASLNAAECFRLHDRGALAPGLRADVVLLDDLEAFHVEAVFIAGRLAAQGGTYVLPTERHDSTATRGSFHVKDFSIDRLRLPLTSSRVHVIDIQPGGVVTGKGIAEVARNAAGEFVHDPAIPVVKLAVIERHQGTGNVALGLLRGYGIRGGAVALSIAHDSHNIIVAGDNDADMACAVATLIGQGGGIVLAAGGRILETMPMPIAGLMSDQSGEWVDRTLARIHQAAHETLHVSRDVDPVMTLCFMSLPVIPELKLTDMGLFDVTRFAFIPIEA